MKLQPPCAGSTFGKIRSLPAACGCDPSCDIHSHLVSTVALELVRSSAASFLESEESISANRHFRRSGSSAQHAANNRLSAVLLDWVHCC